MARCLLASSKRSANNWALVPYRQRRPNRVSAPDTGERRDVRPLRAGPPQRLGPFQFNFPHSPIADRMTDAIVVRRRSNTGSARVAESNSDRKLTSTPPISGAQLRAARALLNWSVRELSDQCRISRSAISRNERVNGIPPMQARNLNTIRQVFEEHGIEFLELDGVRLIIK